MAIYKTEIWRRRRIRMGDGKLVIWDVWGIDRQLRDGFCWGYVGYKNRRVMVKLGKGEDEWKEVGKDEWVRDGQASL